MKKVYLLFLSILSLFLIQNVYAETYDGEYSIEYLLKNYNVVTLGNKKYNLPPEVFFKGNVSSFNEKGIVKDIYSIAGPVLVNGNYTSLENSSFGNLSNNIKSYISGTKGNNITTSSQLVIDPNYIDFNKLYLQVMNTSQALADNTEYHINDAKLEISKPGIYTIHNTAGNYGKKTTDDNYYNISSNNLLIKNYDKNNLYIFNYYDEYVYYLPNVKIMESDSSNAISLRSYIESGQYTGNIIFNFPNAKFIIISVYESNNTAYGGISGNIIAPKSIVFMWTNYSSYDNYIGTSNFYGTIISNSIVGDSYNGHLNSYYYINKANYRLNKKIIENDDKKYVEEVNDFDDDYYSRDYSLSDLLQNYNLVTLGHKAIDSKSKIIQFGNTPGSIKMFHMTGQVLISGDLYGNVYENEIDSYFNNNYTYSTFQKFDRTIFDLESNKVTESYINGNHYTDLKNLRNDIFEKVSLFDINPWDNMTNDNYRYDNRKNHIFVATQKENGQDVWINDNMYEGYGYPVNDYLNFDRLYNNVVAEQSAIDEGKEVKNGEDKVTHIPIGGNYVIEDINNINEIVFDNFDEEKDKLTILTVKNEGDINFPLISKDTGSYKGIVTNDYYGKEKATHLYEQDTFVQDSYHGNIVWNIPNATYIKLKENAPFAGHLIAPNADVETPELHFAGCFIVNSIYGEGNTEAHFYPLTSTATYDVPEYDNLTSSEVQRLNNLRLKRLLGGKGSIIETTVLGDEEEFRKEEAKLNDIIDKEETETKTNNSIPPIIEILQNPLTKRSVLIIGSILTIIGVTIYFTFKKKS